jgi:hypothetical protein
MTDTALLLLLLRLHHVTLHFISIESAACNTFVQTPNPTEARRGDEVVNKRMPEAGGFSS